MGAWLVVGMVTSVIVSRVLSTLQHTDDDESPSAPPTGGSLEIKVGKYRELGQVVYPESD